MTDDQSGAHVHPEYEEALDDLDERVDDLEAAEPPIEPPPVEPPPVEPPPVVEPPVDPPPPSGDGEARLKATLGIRTSSGASPQTATSNYCTSFDNFSKTFGREVAFYRAGGMHDADGENLKALTGNMWSHYVPNSDPRYGWAPKHPKVRLSQILPMITGKGLAVAERAKRMRDTVNGIYDAKWQQMLVSYRGSAPPVKHRFNVSNEPDNPSYFAYRMPDAAEVATLPITLWKECFEYIAAKVHAVGDLVVYCGDGPFFNATAPGGKEWWEWGLPDPDSFDIFACNNYWNEPGGRARTVDKFERTRDVARQLGKPMAVPEYGVAQHVTDRTPTPITSDSDVIGWFNDAWDFLADLPAVGPGSLDHHCVWNENGWLLRPAVFKAFQARLA